MNNHIAPPTVQEFAREHNTELIVLSSPRGDWHAGLIVVAGKPIALDWVVKDKTEAEKRIYETAAIAWREGRVAELRNAMERSTAQESVKRGKRS